MKKYKFINSFLKPLKRTVKKISPAVVIFTLVAGGFVYLINPAGAALVPGGAVGPVVPAGIGKGFPAWYMDQNGLALEVMEAADGFGISDPVDPANAFSQELGFNAEGFYWVTEGAPANPHGVSLMVLALEMAFAGEEAVDGEQSVFGRIRFRFDVGESGTYTIRHPFGTNTYEVAAVGPGLEINDSSDIGCFATLGVLSCDPNNPPGNPNNFGLALQSGIGPFLTWDTFNVDFDPALPGIQPDPLLVNAQNPTKRYVGNPAIDHAIAGSPVGQNFIRVEGPNIGGPGINFIEETQFAVGGRIAVIDTVAPVINATPITVAVGATNVAVSANITDNLGVRSATIDLGSLGNTLSATINNANEVPPTGSTASGSGTFTIDIAANTLSFNINATGLTGGPVTGVHIHQGAAGTNGPMVFNTGSVLPAVGVWNYDEAQEADILAGNMYVQIHTALFNNLANPAGGEIRGQILPQTNVVNMTLVTLPITNGIWSALIPSADRIGTFNLPITATDGSQAANGILVLTVVSPLASVSVAPAAANVVVGNTTQLTAEPIDLDGAPFVGGVTTWSSSNDAIASVDANGLVTGAVLGAATITASVTGAGNTVTNTSAINVTPVPVLTTISVTPAAATLAAGGATQTLTANGLDQFGAAIATGPITWTSSNPLVATVDAAGVITPVAAGTATITAAGGAISGTATVSVVELTSVAVTPNPGTVVVGSGGLQMTAAPQDQNGAAFSGAAITWSSDNQAAATVNANTGLVTAVAAGTANITATAVSGAVSASGVSVVTVVTEPQVLTSVSVTPASATLTAGTQQLTANGLDQFGGAMAVQPAFTWSSDNAAVATVDASGLVTAVGAGTAAITATGDALSGNSAITVNQVLATTNVTPNPVSVLVGGTTQLSASALDQFGTPMAPQPVFTWNSATPAAVTVDANGLASGIIVGTSVVSASSGLVSGNVTVNSALETVAPVITMNGANPINILVGSIYVDAGATATDNVDGEIASTSPNFVITGLPISTVATGTFSVVYSVTDAAGNNAAASRTVNVVNDITPPVITILGNNPASVTVNTAYTDAGATASDDIDGDITANIQATGADGDTSNIGSFTVTYTVSDATGNAAASTRTVNVTAAPSSGGAVIGGGGGGGGGGGFFLPPSQFQTTAPTITISPEVQAQIDRQLEIEREFRQGQNRGPGGQVLGERIEFRQNQIREIEIEAEFINANDLNALLANTNMIRLTSKENEARAKFTVKLKIETENLSDEVEAAITNFIAYGTSNTKKLGEGERAGVLDSFKAAFGKLPTTRSEWEDALKIAVGRFPGKASATAEARAKVEFRAIYLRDASMNNENDKAAVTVMAYGLRPDKRNLDSERAAIRIFKSIFRADPSSAIDWDKVRAIAYSGAKR